MSAGPKPDVNIVRKFHPFDSQSNKKIKEIIAKSMVQNLPEDRVLFKHGDRDDWTIYLLCGEIELVFPNGKKQLIEADTESALNSISNQIPRLATATSHTEISILIIDRSLLQVILNHNDGGIEVAGIDDDDDEDWMSRFLQSNAFLRLPVANIQALIMRLKEEHLSAGTVVIEENSQNEDKFYIIQEGTCLVTKTNPSTAREMTLAQLSYGTGFGEEALITGGVRNASVTMETDGTIMILEKKDFLDLLVEPLIHRIRHNELDELISNDNSLLIDVRDENEFSHKRINNTVQNIPIHMIRSQLEQLDEDKHYIVYSNHESRSSAAAFLFIQQGFDCSILEYGISKEAPTDIRNTEAIESSVEKQAPIAETVLTAEHSCAVTEEKESLIPEKNTGTDKSLSEQLSAAENRCKKIEALAAGLKSKAQEAIKFARLKARQLELMNKKLKSETQRADHAEAQLKKAQAKIKQLKQ